MTKRPRKEPASVPIKLAFAGGCAPNQLQNAPSINPPNPYNRDIIPRDYACYHKHVSQQDAKKPPFRPLNIAERDTLFAYYEKHNGNMLAMTRDRDCQFKAHSQIRYYAKLYNFAARLVEVRRKKADEVLAQLKDSKIEAIRRAVEMIAPRQVPLRNKKGDLILDADGQPIFHEFYPNDREIKVAWEIIKTELGEPTSVSKSEVTNKQDEDVKAALDALAQLTKHGGIQSSGGAIQGERQAAGDTPEAPAAVRDDTAAPAPEE